MSSPTLTNLTSPLPSTGTPYWLCLIVCALSLALFIAALFLPALYLDRGKIWTGTEAFRFGCMGITIGCVAWYANVLLAIAQISVLCKWWWPAILLSGLALILGVTTFAMRGSTIPMDHTVDLGPGQGVEHHAPTIIGFGLGAYVWLASLLVPGAGALWLRFHAPPTLGAAVEISVRPQTP